MKILSTIDESLFLRGPALNVEETAKDYYQMEVYYSIDLLQHGLNNHSFRRCAVFLLPI